MSDATWSTAVTDVSGDTTVTIPSAADHFLGVHNTFQNYDAGEWILSSGWADAENNGLFKIESIGSTGAPTTEYDQLFVYATLTAAGNPGTPGIDITQGSSITNGVLLKTMVIEKEFTDLTNKYERCLGMAITGNLLSH